MCPEGFGGNASQLLFIHTVCHANSIDLEITAVTQYHGIRGGITADIGSAVCDKEQRFLAAFAGLGHNFFNGLVQCKACSSSSGNKVQVF